MEVFELDSSKLNEIVYSMENQTKDSFINIHSGEIVPKDVTISDRISEFYPLPEWGSVDGFRIMNDFVFHLKNPVVKQELKAVLNSGHGVFRKFKNVLKGSPEVEKIWFSYKRDEIKSKVINWYNQIREYAGLELFHEDDFEEEDLLDFDFTVNTTDSSSFQTIKKWDLVAFKELYSNYPDGATEEIYWRKREILLTETMFNSDTIFVAENPTGEKVGFIWAVDFVLGQNYTGMDLLQLYVVPEYRGLGIGKMLLNKILDIYKKGEYKELIVNCQGETSWLKTYLELEGYKLAFQELNFRL